jgi:hypothetical protein
MIPLHPKFLIDLLLIGTYGALIYGSSSIIMDEMRVSDRILGSFFYGISH